MLEVNSETVRHGIGFKQKVVKEAKITEPG
jgi:hypothetical protein